MKTFLFSLKFPKIWVGYVFFKWYFEKKWVGQAMGNEPIYWDGQKTKRRYKSAFDRNSAVYSVHIIENLHFVSRKLFILVFIQNLYAGISRLNFNNSNCASSELSRQFQDKLCILMFKLSLADVGKIIV